MIEQPDTQINVHSIVHGGKLTAKVAGKVMILYDMMIEHKNVGLGQLSLRISKVIINPLLIDMT